ncbi:MAG: SAM-dependent chlorinase/fluorinase [Candidatus Omnitrophica bacterium]|nr:SAM-dependent chlorinase/fluorinase [Candidatus Omnitrophota bacterium]
MKSHRVITLLTDFGNEGGFASALKGVILSINPNVQLVDVCHQIAPQNIFEGAFALFVNYRFFPKDTIHVAVVDPGVGSKRKILCACTPSGIFVGPDNGIFTPILDRERKSEVFEVNNPKLFLTKISNTFHGRDKMAPAAAHLAAGFPLEQVGPRLKSWERIDLPRPKIERSKITGKVISIDRFGNLITNITGDDISCLGNVDSLSVRIKKRVIPKMVRYFGEAEKGEILAIVGSSNFVEIAQNMGSAARFLKTKIGEIVEVRK